ncbi:MAG: L-threonine 3-dehydrogenase [Acidimicrobiia bacterium]|nr:L-threonine 3-dehydrogenase [Acidimicrobiia bacterium]
MRALRKTAPAPGLELCDIDRPVVGHGEVLIEVQRMAICGTDLHIYKWDEWAAETIPVPLTLGHEFMGVVAEVGDHVSAIDVGQRVTAEGHITCGKCRNCRAGRRHFCRNTIGIGVQRDGAFAEFVAVPEFNVYPIPDHIDDDTAAILDPLGNAVHTALTFDLVGEDVLITGAGPIGLMAVPIAQRAGARHVVVTDLNDNRLKVAEELGATRTVNVARQQLRDVMADLGMQEGFDVGLEMSGAPPALAAMIDTMNHGGRIALLGLVPDGTAIDWSDVIFKGLTVQGIYGRKMFDTWYKAAALLEEGLDVSPIIGRRYRLDDFESAFDAIASGDVAKVLFGWD